MTNATAALQNFMDAHQGELENDALSTEDRAECARLYDAALAEAHDAYAACDADHGILRDGECCGGCGGMMTAERIGSRMVWD